MAEGAAPSKGQECAFHTLDYQEAQNTGWKQKQVCKLQRPAASDQLHQPGLRGPKAPRTASLNNQVIKAWVFGDIPDANDITKCKPEVFNHFLPITLGRDG